MMEEGLLIDFDGCKFNTPHDRSIEPPPGLIRGRCPHCGDHLVSHIYWAESRGYICKWKCWESIAINPKCDYVYVV